MVSLVYLWQERLKLMVAFLCVLRNTIIKTQKTGLHTDLLLTYNLQFRSLVSLNPRLLKFNYESLYVSYNLYDSLYHYILQL